MKKGKYECNGKPYARVSSRTSVGLRVVGYLNLKMVITKIMMVKINNEHMVMNLMN